MSGRRARLRGLDRDAGSATIWVLGAISLIVLVAAVTTIRVAAVVVRHRAESAADLAALAGAQRIGAGGGSCPAAAAIARRNGARLVACSTILAPDLRSGTVTARVSITVRLPLAGTQDVTASARAGRLAGARR